MPRQSKVFPTLTLLSLIGLTTSHLPSRADDSITPPSPTATETIVSSDGITKTVTDTNPNSETPEDKKIKPPRYKVVDLGDGYDVIAETGSDYDNGWWMTDRWWDSDNHWAYHLDYGQNLSEGLPDSSRPDQLQEREHYLGEDESKQRLADGWYYGAPTADLRLRLDQDKMDFGLNNRDQIVVTYNHPEMQRPFDTALLQGNQTIPLGGLVNAVYDVRNKDNVSVLERWGEKPDSLEAKLDASTHWVVNHRVYGPRSIKIAMIRAYGINDNARIVGVAVYPGGLMACEYVNGKLHLLPTVPHGNTAAMAINNSGQILVLASTRTVAPADHTSNAHYQTLIYNNGGVTNLGYCDGHEVRGLAMNNSGQVAGTSYVRVNNPSWARVIKRGEIQDAKIYHASLYTNGKWKDLGTLGGETSCATAINDQGEVTGWSLTKEGACQAFLYSNGKMKALGRLESKMMIGRGINNHGDIVGWKSGDGFLYSRGKAWTLSNLIEPKSDIKSWNPFCINYNGIILAHGIPPYESFPAFSHLYALVPIKDKDDKSENSDTNDDNNTTPIIDKPQPAVDDAAPIKESNNGTAN